MFPTPVRTGYKVWNCCQRNPVLTLTRRWIPHLRNGGVAGRGQSVKVIKGPDTLLGDQRGMLVRSFVIDVSDEGMEHSMCACWTWTGCVWSKYRVRAYNDDDTVLSSLFSIDGPAHGTPIFRGKELVLNTYAGIKHLALDNDHSRFPFKFWSLHFSDIKCIKYFFKSTHSK